MAKKRERIGFSEQLREAINASELTRYRICLETGITQPVMSRFMSGTGGMSLDGIERICDLLDLELVTRPATASRSKRKKG
jgi:transcriptional regulator with XRE-family HTH domain